MRETTDPIAFVREIMRDALWHIAYHEHELPKAIAELEYAKALMRRANIDMIAERADINDDGDKLAKNITQFALQFYDEKDGDVEHHEERLREAYRNVGFAKTLLMRGNYTEIDLKEIEAEVAEEKRKWEEEEKEKKEKERAD